MKFSNFFALLYPDPDCKSVYGSGLQVRIWIRIANPDTDTDCKSGYGSGLQIRICPSCVLTLPFTGYHVSFYIVIERVRIGSSILSTVYNIVTFNKPKNMLIIIFSNFLYQCHIMTLLRPRP
jgi:hypothetical protein